MIAARASAKATLAALLVSFDSALSMTGSALSSCPLKTDCAAAMRLAGSGDISVRLPTAASTVRRSRLLRRTGAALSGSLYRLAGHRIDDLAVLLGDVDLLGVAVGRQPAVLKRVDDGKRERVAGNGDAVDRFLSVRKLVIGKFGYRILEGARECRQGQGSNQERGKDKRTKTIKGVGNHWRTPAEVMEKTAAAPPSPFRKATFIMIPLSPFRHSYPSQQARLRSRKPRDASNKIALVQL